MAAVCSVLITGCSSGLGLELVTALASLPGFSVHASVRSLNNPGYLTEALEKIKPTQKSCVTTHEIDVTSSDTITKAVSNILAKDGKIDVVLCNGAVALAGFSETVTEAEMKHIFDVNVFGVVRYFDFTMELTVRLLQGVLPSMREKKSGHFIAISSVSAMGTPTGLGFYGSSKAAVEALLQAEAALLKEWNIKVTVLQSGTFVTKTPHMAEKVQIGSRKEYPVQGTDFYAHQLAAKKVTYMKYVPIVGIPVDSVVNQIVSLVTNKNYHDLDFQIQTENEATNFAEKYFVDPTGNTHVNHEIEQTKFFLSLHKQ